MSTQGPRTVNSVDNSCEKFKARSRREANEWMAVLKKTVGGDAEVKRPRAFFTRKGARAASEIENLADMEDVDEVNIVNILQVQLSNGESSSSNSSSRRRGRGRRPLQLPPPPPPPPPPESQIDLPKLIISFPVYTLLFKGPV
jgi:hypothetical protein